MSTITIDGKKYDAEALTEEAKAQLKSIQYVDSELARLQAQAAALQTARIAYVRAIKDTLENGPTLKDDEVTIEDLGQSINFEE